MDTVLTSSEIEFFIETMREYKIDEVASDKWIDWHERLQKLNQQAVIEAATMRDEQVKDTLIAFNKSALLVREVILLDVWKHKILPHLLQFVPEPENTFIAYSVLYQEALALSLLEVIMFYEGGVESLGDSAIDLFEYAYDNVSQLIVRQPDSNLTVNSTSQGELMRQKQELSFDVGIKSVTIIRYLSEHLERVPLGVVSRLYDTFDVPTLFVQLLLEKPWRKDGKVFSKGKWLPHSDALSQIEAQVWLTLRHLLLDKACQTHYRLTDTRKVQLMKVLPMMSAILLDQLSPLIELQQLLYRLAAMNPPDNVKPPLLMEILVEVKRKIMQEVNSKWKKVAREQIDTVFCTDKNRLKYVADKLSAAYNTDFLENLEMKGDGKCTICDQPAIQRCAKCKQDFYCSRQCQVKDWKNHKDKCLGVTLNK